MQTDLLRDHVVLVVGNNSCLEPDLQENLEAAGATVAHTALQDAPRVVGEGKISVAIMDCHPRSRERRALTRRLRHENVPVLFYGMEAPGDVTTERGASFIARPSSAEKIVAAVRYLLR